MKLQQEHLESKNMQEDTKDPVHILGTKYEHKWHAIHRQKELPAKQDKAKSIASHTSSIETSESIPGCS